MQVHSNGKTRRTATEWRQILDRFSRSGLSVAAFCERESIVPTSLHRWREKLGKDTKAIAPSREFVDVLPRGEAFPAFWSVEIELPDGKILRVRG
jgi:hypothetical protein